MVDRYNTDLANNLGNLLSRVATVVAKKCGGVGPAPRPDSPLAAVAAEAYADTAEAWDRVQPSVALEATWRLIRETNAYLEANEPWKADPGPEVDAVLGDALEALRIVAILASPAVPDTCAEIWRRIGLAGRPEDQRLPAAAAWGGYPGGLAVEKGDAAVPPPGGLNGCAGPTTTATSHRPDRRRRRGRRARRRRRAGVTRLVNVGTDVADSTAPPTVPRPTLRLGHRRRPPP